MIAWETPQSCRARSLITPGGIATLAAAAGIPCAGQVRSLPLEGSQLATWLHRLRGLGVRSLPLEGSQPIRLRDELRGGAGSLITPGGIATSSGSGWPTMSAQFAHYPWRDRNETQPAAT